MGPESRKVDYMINKLELATTDGGVALWKTPVPGRGPCLLLSSVCLSFGQRFGVLLSHYIGTWLMRVVSWCRCLTSKLIVVYCTCTI